MSGKVLVSACLLGELVRHDGRHKRIAHPILQRWLDERLVVPVCPEIAGGLPVPRPAAEIERGAGGQAVLDGAARVRDVHGADVTPAFVAGAQQALALARASGARVVVLKARSPSCGVRESHDGAFAGGLVPRSGVTAALLTTQGVAVFDEFQLEAADRALRCASSRDVRG